MEISGKLTALSHILISSPPCFVLELCNNAGRQIIIVTEQNLFKWLDFLLINDAYIVSGLLTTACFKGESLRTYTAQKSSVCQLRSNLSFSRIQLQYTSSPNAVISGIITEVDPHLGLVTIDNIHEILVSYQLALSDIPTLYEGQRVTFYNIHKAVHHTKSDVYVMCSRGYVFRHSIVEGQKCISRDILLPIISIAMKQAMGWADLLWLHEEAKVICGAFPLDFMKKWFKSSESAANIRISLISELAQRNVVPNPPSVEQRSLLKEFLEVDNHTCLPMKHSHLRSKSHTMLLKNVLERAKSSPNVSLPCPEGEMGRELKERHYSESMAGILTQAPDKVIYHLIDSDNSVPVLVTSRKQLVQSGDIKHLLNNMVVISNFLVVNHRYILKNLLHRVPLCAVHLEVDVQNIFKIQSL